jgi:hypothetical protein
MIISNLILIIRDISSMGFCREESGIVYGFIVRERP